MKLNFVRQNKIYLIFTALLVVLAIAALWIWGLKLGIDFQGGTIIEYKFSSNISKEELNEKVGKLQGIKLERIFELDDSTYRMYFEPLSEEDRKHVESTIESDFKDSKRLSVETISSSVGRDQAYRALISILVASVVIIIFLTITFRQVPTPFSSVEFGVSAVIALLHDSIIVLGVFALLGHFYFVEIDTQFITAILTVIGFSVHDTIVVFDRIRENISKEPLTDYKVIINRSLLETLARSLNLTVTALLVLACLFVLGPDSLKSFTLALIIGMLSGTYSSIFVASQLLILFQDLKKNFKLPLSISKK